MANCLLMKISMNPPVVMYGCGEKELGQSFAQKEDGNFDQQSYLQAEDACNFLLEDSSGKIWIGGKNGLKSISEQGEVKEFYTYEYYFTHAIEVEGMIYFSTMESELLIYDMKRGIFEEVTPAFNDAMTHLFRLSSHDCLFSLTPKVYGYMISHMALFISLD